MREFIKKNRAITWMGIGSITIVFLYAASYYLPDIFLIEPWLRLLDGLALSYIAALIFYIEQVYLPERNMVRKAIAANAYDFEKAIELIDVTCLLWENYTEVGNNRLKVKWNGTKPGEQEMLFFAYVVGDTEAIECYTKTDLMNLYNTFVEHVKNIKQSALFRHFDEETLAVIAEMEHCNFFYEIRSQLYLMGSQIDVRELGDVIDYTRKLSDKIKMLVNYNKECKLREISPESIAIARCKKDGSYIKGVDYFNQEVNKERIREAIMGIASAGGLSIDRESIENAIEKGP